MEAIDRRALVVGVDGSPAGKEALRWALDAAARRRAGVRVVHALELSLFDVRLDAAYGPGWETPLRTSMRQMLDEIVADAARSHPDVTVETRLEAAPASVILVEESERADTVVLGKRGTGGFANLVIGSTTLHVATNAHCPVVAVPTAPAAGPARRGVVVGVDGTPAAEPVIEYAFRAADEAGEPLMAVHTWRDPAPMGPGVMMPLVYDPTLVTFEERLLLSEMMAGWSQKYPDVEVQQTVLHAHAVPSLVEEARAARLLVVGCRRRGDLKSLLLGSVSHGVLHRACGPVAVVPRTG
ncbi:MAG: universal stress protein [Actinomycetes bacterium]